MKYDEEEFSGNGVEGIKFKEEDIIKTIDDMKIKVIRLIGGMSKTDMINFIQKYQLFHYLIIHV